MIEIRQRKSGKRYRAAVMIPRTRRKRRGPWRSKKPFAQKDEKRIALDLKLEDMKWEVNCSSSGILKSEGEEKKTTKKQRVTMDELHQIFEKEFKLKLNAPSTNILDAATYQQRIAPYIGNKLLEDIDHYILQDLIDGHHNGLLGLPMVGHKRANKLHSMLNLMFRWAVKKRFMESSPMYYVDRVREKRSEKKAKRLDFLTKEEAERALAWLWDHDKWLYPIITGLLVTATRWGELKALQKRDLVELDQGMVVYVRRSYCKMSNILNAVPKRKERMVPLSKRAQLFFRILTKDNQDEDFIFFESKADCRHPTKVVKHWKKCEAAIGLSRHVSLKGLARHTYATETAKKGIDSRIGSSIMGNSPKIFENNYMHITAAMFEGAEVDYDLGPGVPNRVPICVPKIKDSGK